jgi:hypothetical protein
MAEEITQILVRSARSKVTASISNKEVKENNGTWLKIKTTTKTNANKEQT